MKLPSLAALLLLPHATHGHSWLACADYRGDVNFYDESECLGYPRRWESARGAGALTPLENGYHIAADTGYNFQPADDNSACQFSMADDPLEDDYTVKYPHAVYEVGETYCLAWPMKNHAAATCTNEFIPDTSLKLFLSDVDPNADPAQSEFRERNVNDMTSCASDDKTSDACQLGLEKHEQGAIDCAGFQRSPRFCDDTDKAMGTGCFVVPESLAAGRYVFQWYWEFNIASFYSTCFDVEVVASGAGRGGGGTTGTPDPVEGSGMEGECANNFVDKFGGSSGGGGGDDDDGGTSQEQPDLSGNAFEFIDETATTVAARGDGESFDVDISYVSTGGRTFFLDVFNYDGATVYGSSGAVALGEAASPTTTTVSVTLTTDIPNGLNVFLKGWIVQDEYVGNPAVNDFEETRLDLSVCFGDAEACASSSVTTHGGGGDGDAISKAGAVAIALFAGLFGGVALTVAWIRVHSQGQFRAGNKGGGTRTGGDGGSSSVNSSSSSATEMVLKGTRFSWKGRESQDML